MSKYAVFVTFLVVCFCSLSLQAQTYNTAFGARVGNGFDLTLQQYIRNGWTVEPIVHTSLFSKNLGATLLAEKHYKVLIRNLNVYVGGGAHYYARTEANKSTEIVHNVFGLTAIGGAELSLGRLNFSVDFKPEVRLAGDQIHPFRWNGIAVSGRYIIDKRERHLFKKRNRDRFDDWRDRNDNRNDDRNKNNKNRDRKRFRS